MVSSSSRLLSGTALSLLMSCALLALPAGAQELTEETDDGTVVLDTLVVSAEEQAKQALGASTITAEDIAKQPVTNDISQIVRRMPGVNLTGNGVGGQRGNQRQIDIRGMGPENTLILIDGKPVLSRNAVRMGRQGERDTRGDSNWVPAELVERIEVLRGPAAARYGSGAAGGVVNIITKKPTALTTSVGVHYEMPENDKEGDTRRINLSVSGPISDTLSFRVYGNYNRTQNDDADINATGTGQETAPAGSEGVVNKDIGTLLSWTPIKGHKLDFEFTFSRQGNLYAGDQQTGSDVITDVDGRDLIGTETNRMLRRTLSVTHNGEYSFGNSFSYLQWESTSNTRLDEGTAGGGEGNINALDWNTHDYDVLTGKTEWTLPFDVLGRPGKLTLGAEYRGERMDDGGDEFTVSDYQKQNLIGLYVEDNILLSDALTLTPGLRFDYSDRFGSNWSPSLNAKYAFTEEWSMKAGVARAFKAPNIFQMNPDYIYSTMGNGCPVGVPRPCYIYGNDDLEAEWSINSEIGVAYEGFNGINGSLTYFHNDYHNRIAADLDSYEDYSSGGALLRWNNIPRALIKGIEGNFSTDLGSLFHLNVNFTKMIKSVNKQTGNPLSLVPKHTVNASLDYFASDKVTVTMAMTHYGTIPAARKTLSTNTGVAEEIPRPSYTLFDLSTKWDMGEGAVVSAGITNLFDKEVYREANTQGNSNNFNEAGRAFYVAINKTF